MTRLKSSVTHKKRVKKVLRAARGYYGRRKNTYSVAKQSVMRAGAHAFASRRKKKGDFRRLWQVRINAALTMLASPADVTTSTPPKRLSYSQFIHKLKLAQVALNRKTLAYLAVHDFKGFQKVVTDVTDVTDVTAN